MSAILQASVVRLPVSGQVHLWLTPEWQPLSADSQQRYAAWLNADEQQRWHRFRFAADRQRFLQARALVRSVLAAYLQQSPAELQFSCNQYGKPQLRQMPASLKFNLSHTHGMLALAVSTGAEVGVDVEAVTRNVETVALAERFFAPSETALIKVCEGDQQRDCFFSLWTLKEAYVKARGLGLQLGLDSFAFEFDAAGLPRLSFSDASDDAALWSFIRLQHAEGFCVALAVQAAGISSANLTLLTPDFQVQLR